MPIMVNTPRLYVYVDGESHFSRTEDKARKTFGCTALEELQRVKSHIGIGSVITTRSDCKFFWDTSYFGPASPAPQRKYYFTAFTGIDQDLIDAKSFVRAHGFDPEIIKEPKDLRTRRKNQLDDLRLIEKPKGSDIALTSKMIEDAASDNYDSAILFTSDADFIPVIRAVRRLGKYVAVYGYKENLGNEELAFIPDYFRDLAYHFSQPNYYERRIT
jgi:uncharacterized LabA/DUF88 family protein